MPASVPPAAAAGTDVKEPAAAAQTQPPAATAAPAAAGVGSAEPQVEAQQPAAAQPQAAAAADGSAPAADAATVPPTTSGQEAPAAAAAPKLATFGAGSSMFSGGGFGALGALRHSKSVGGNRLLPGPCTRCHAGRRKGEGLCCQSLHSCLAWASCHVLSLTATAVPRLERQLTLLPPGEHAQSLLQHLRQPLLLAGQSGTTFGFASGAGTKDTAKSDSQDGKAAPAFSFGAAGTSFPSVASVLGTSDGEGSYQMTQTSPPSHVAYCSQCFPEAGAHQMAWAPAQSHVASAHLRLVQPAGCSWVNQGMEIWQLWLLTGLAGRQLPPSMSYGGLPNAGSCSLCGLTLSRRDRGNPNHRPQAGGFLLLPLSSVVCTHIAGR